MAQIAMVMNLDKCICCHTCSVPASRSGPTTGTEYVYFNNVTKPGVGYPRRYEDQEQWQAAAWTARDACSSRRGDANWPQSSTTPTCPRSMTTATLNLRLSDPHPDPARHRTPARTRFRADRRTWTSMAATSTTTYLARPSSPLRPEPNRARRPSQEEFEQVFMYYLPQDLRALPKPVLRHVLPVRGHVQREEDRIVLVIRTAAEAGGYACLLPLQEGVLQPPHRQGEKCTLCFPRDRNRTAHYLLGDLRKPATLPEPVPLRHRPGTQCRNTSGA